LKAIGESGLSVNGALGTFTTHPRVAEKLDFRPDYVFLTVKTQDVLPALKASRAFLDGVPVVTFQNGMRSDELVATLIPPAQIISAVVNIGASYLTPGTVTINYPGSLIIGRPFGELDAEVHQLASLLNAVVPTRASANIKGAHCLKLILNLNNALPAITNLGMTQVYADPYLRQLAVRVMREGIKVVNRAHIRMETLPDASVTLVQMMAILPIQLAASITAGRVRRIQSEWPLIGSTLQSLRRGRPTEIDYLNGEIARLGQQHNIATPLNTAIVEMVHQIEKDGQFWPVGKIREYLASH
jgi:2-dehydropantoate 2-reductase